MYFEINFYLLVLKFVLKKFVAFLNQLFVRKFYYRGKNKFDIKF